MEGLWWCFPALFLVRPFFNPLVVVVFVVVVQQAKKKPLCTASTPPQGFGTVHPPPLGSRRSGLPRPNTESQASPDHQVRYTGQNGRLRSLRSERSERLPHTLPSQVAGLLLQGVIFLEERRVVEMRGARVQRARTVFVQYEVWFWRFGFGRFGRPEMRDGLVCPHSSR